MLDQNSGPGAHSYGELTPLGFRNLCKRIALYADDVFVDAGSGLGRIVLQAAKEYGVKRALGVEYLVGRHAIAAAAAAREPYLPVRFVCDDCAARRLWTEPAAEPAAKGKAEKDAAADDGAFVGASVVFACSLMFSTELMGRFARCIEACPTVRCVHAEALPSKRADGFH